MKFMCIGKCFKTVDSKEDIPSICSCGLGGKWSYYPVDYIYDYSKKLYELGSVASESDGYFMVLKMLRDKIPKEEYK